MKIRRANAHDLEPIRDLIIHCSNLFIIPDFEPNGVLAYKNSHSLERMREKLNQFHYQVLVQEDQKIIGVVGMQNSNHLYHLHVAPEFHGRGYGRMLWSAAKVAALSSGEIQRFTVNSSRYAVPFYEKLGFIGKCKKVENGVIYFPMILGH